MKELQEEATGLGLDFTGIKSKSGISELIEGYYKSQEGSVVKSVDDVVEEDEIEVAKPTKKLSKEARLRQLIKKMKDKAMATKIVTITNNDRRDNSVLTTTYLGFENQYFGMSRIVDLDTPIELEQCLIDIAKGSQVVLHTDEIVNGKRTGNKTPKLVKKFSVSLEDITK